MIKEAICVTKCLCLCSGFSLKIEVENSLPDQIVSESTSGNRNEQRWAMWTPSSSDGFAYVKFEIDVDNGDSQSEGSVSSLQIPSRRYNSEGVEGGLSISVCKKLVRMMQENVWVVPNSYGGAQSMPIVLKLQRQASIGGGIFEPGGSSEHPLSNSLFRCLQVTVADGEDVSRVVTSKLLEKLGCNVTTVSSGFECLSALGPAGTSFHIVLLDLQLPEMDGF